MTGNPLTILATFRRQNLPQDEAIYIIASSWARAAELAKTYNETELPTWKMTGMALMSNADVLIDPDALR